MTRRLLLVAAAAAFVGWIAWLALAVSKAGTVPIVSRAQLTAASHLLVVELTLAPDGPPERKVKVVEVLSGDGLKPGDELEVDRIRSAKIFVNSSRTKPEAGLYLVPVTRTGDLYQVAGLPRSPGYEPGTPEWPVIYQWNEDVKAQLRALGIVMK